MLLHLALWQFAWQLAWRDDSSAGPFFCFAYFDSPLNFSCSFFVLVVTDVHHNMCLIFRNVNCLSVSYVFWHRSSRKAWRLNTANTDATAVRFVFHLRTIELSNSYLFFSLRPSSLSPNGPLVNIIQMNVDGYVFFCFLFFVDYYFQVRVWAVDLLESHAILSRGEWWSIESINKWIQLSLGECLRLDFVDYSHIFRSF